jgi:Flp pilus assembly protein TadG
MRQRLNIRNERGQTMTEFAIILPILVVLLFGIAQFGIAFNNYVTITDAARAGARKGAVSRNSSDPTGDCVSQVKASAADLDLSKLSVSCSSPWSIGSDVTVDVEYPYTISLFGLPVVSGNLKTVMKERVE